MSALTFTSVLGRTAVCEVLKRDCRICTHFHTETLLIVIEPCPPIKQAICLASLTWNVGRACLSLWEYKGNKTDTVIDDLPVYLGQKDHQVQNNQKEMLHCTAVHKEGINVISKYDQILN